MAIKMHPPSTSMRFLTAQLDPLPNRMPSMDETKVMNPMMINARSIFTSIMAKETPTASVSAP